MNHLERTGRIIAAAESTRVLVLSPLGGRTRHPLEWGMQLAFGTDLMDPSTRPPAARAGHEQGRALAGRLAAFWR